ELHTSKSSLLDAGLGVLRGGYRRMLISGTLASMVGITLVAPLTVATARATGPKRQREDRRRQRRRRRPAAEPTYPSYVDEVSFVVSKQSRDTRRQLHRELRDGWSERARELQRSARQALAAAEEASRSASAGREARRADLRAELERIDALRREARALLTDEAATR